MAKKPKEILTKLFSGSQPGHGGQKPEQKNPKPVMVEPKCVFFIVDWSRLKDIISVFENDKTGFHFINKGRGTATSEIMDLLGIGSNDKAIIVNLKQPETVPFLLKEVRKKLDAGSQGAGIAFTIPFSGINSPLLRLFAQPELTAGDSGVPAADSPPEKKVFSHSLIISVINQGHSEAFMNTARKAGAAGGTVISARGQTHESAVKFFGISVQDEKEIILILISQEKKDAVMNAVFNAHGLDSKAHGIIFSLPVDRIMSLSFEQAINA